MKKSVLKRLSVLIIALITVFASSGCNDYDAYDMYSGGGGGGYYDDDYYDDDRDNDRDDDGWDEVFDDDDEYDDKYDDDLFDDDWYDDDDRYDDDRYDDDRDEQEFINPLSGKSCTKEIANTRPVVFMINNLKESLPQVGISEAEILYEVLAEGGITRLIGVYNNYKRIPEIGSVRSAREYCLDISDAHDAIFVHAGQSESAKKAIISRGTDNINGEYMYRSAERRKTMAYEHTLMMSGKGLTEAIQAKKYRSTTDAVQPLSFRKNEAVPRGKSASYIEFPFAMGKTKNPYSVSFFNYDKNSGVYKKGHHGTEHIDGDDGKVISFKNVIILECVHKSTGDAEGHINVQFTGKGTGKLFTMGKYIDIVWEKASATSSYTLYESDGKTVLKLNPGKSYIGIVPTGTSITIK